MFTFRLFGIPVSVTTSAAWLAGIYLLFGLQARSHPIVIVGGILITFVSILVHELGHAAAGTGFGLGPIDITLHGFGGLTRHRRADKPWKDLVVSLAGPGFGFALGFVFLAISRFVPLGDIAWQLVSRGLFVNLVWSVFNLAPLYPLDGGQALAAVLKIAIPAQAWNITTIVGLVGGVLMGLGGLAMMGTGGANGVFLLFIAVNIVQNNLSVRSQLGEAARRA